MKTNGFSLIELLVVTVIVSILITYGFSTYSNSRIKAQRKIEQQYLLQIPVLIEDYFAENLIYPDSLDDFLTAENGQFKTPRNYYSLNYALDQNNNYKVTATLNVDIDQSGLIQCHRLVINSSGKLLAFNSDDADISKKCWN